MFLASATLADTDTRLFKFPLLLRGCIGSALPYVASGQCCSTPPHLITSRCPNRPKTTMSPSFLKLMPSACQYAKQLTRSNKQYCIIPRYPVLMVFVLLCSNEGFCQLSCQHLSICCSSALHEGLQCQNGRLVVRSGIRWPCHPLALGMSSDAYSLGFAYSPLGYRLEDSKYYEEVLQVSVDFYPIWAGIYEKCSAKGIETTECNAS